MRTFGKTVHPYEFKNLNGRDFERLVFAFALRRWSWHSIDWFGQSGNDEGRDVIGLREDAYGRDETVVIACANWQNLTLTKGAGDLDKIARSVTKPSMVYVIGGGAASSDLKTKLSAHGKALGIRHVETWSGTEFEEHLRAYAETVADRFFRGEELPDDVGALRAFVDATPANEEEGLRILARIFDRPAFKTRFQDESSLPAFSHALANTVEALNTGLWRTRDGALIGRVPSKHDFKSKTTKAALARIVDSILSLRTTFDRLKVANKIKPCSCGKPDCSVVFSEKDAAAEMNRLRYALLSDLHALVPEHVPPPDLLG